MEVEREATDRIESALQEVPYLEKITSRWFRDDQR